MCLCVCVQIQCLTSSSLLVRSSQAFRSLCKSVPTTPNTPALGSAYAGTTRTRTKPVVRVCGAMRRVRAVADKKFHRQQPDGSAASNEHTQRVERRRYRQECMTWESNFDATVVNTVCRLNAAVAFSMARAVVVPVSQCHRRPTTSSSIRRRRPTLSAKSRAAFIQFHRVRLAHMQRESREGAPTQRK